MPAPISNQTLVRVLAGALLAGESTPERVAARAAQVLGRPWRWLKPLAGRYCGVFGGGTRPRLRDAVGFLLRDRGFCRALRLYADQIFVADWLPGPPVMQPVKAAEGWILPALETPASLAEWLHLNPGELEWFANLKGLPHGKDSPRLEHYHYRFLPKRSGGLRLIEAPKRNLKEVQRRILEEILNRVPPHAAAHGFVKGRSIRSFVFPHTGRYAVLRMDLEDFFPSFQAARVQTVFRTLGYPERVADLLGGLCTNSLPRHVKPEQPWPSRYLYSQPHLPQGAPTSPALANVCTYRLDCRLAGLASAAGALYTRYADDLAFSGGEEFARCAARFSAHVAAVVREEGLTVNHRKTRLMRQGVRQHLAGLTANSHLNTGRAEYDRLKATLTNCVRFGTESQNRDRHPAFRSHLEGRVSFVESINPARGKRLRAVLDLIP